MENKFSLNNCGANGSNLFEFIGKGKMADNYCDRLITNNVNYEYGCRGTHDTQRNCSEYFSLADLL